MSGPVPGDPDAYPEPILNVASLGKGTIAIPNSARPGDLIKLTAGEFIPRTRASYRLNGRLLGDDNVNLSGGTGLTITVPDLPYGRYKVEITNHRKTVTDTILVRPKVLLSAPSGTVGQSVSVSLRGYGASESVLITFETGNGVRSLVRVRASSLGVATALFVVPPSTRGPHRVTATDGAGHSTYAHFTVQPSMTADSPVAAGEWSAVSLRGFRAGESVDLHWDSADGAVIRTKLVTATGSGDVNVRIPADSTDGAHSLWAVGGAGTQVRVTVSSFSAAADPTPTVTITEVDVPGATPTQTDRSPTIGAATQTSTTDIPTEPETEVPTDVPTETPTEEATVESVETATVVE
jgi:hypothetical protein